MRPAIRRATPADQPAVVALDAGCFPSDAWGAASWRDEFTRSDRCVLVADDGAVRGYAVLLVPPEPADPVDLLRIAVDPAWRRAGIGRQLLTAALAACPGRTVLLEVADGNEAAAELYREFGFEEISRRRAYYATGADAVVMRRQEKET